MFKAISSLYVVVLSGKELETYMLTFPKNLKPHFGPFLGICAPKKILKEDFFQNDFNQCSAFSCCNFMQKVRKPQ